MRKAILFVGLIVFVGFALSATAQAQPFEVHVTVAGHAGTVSGSTSDNLLSFSAPVEVPGVGLAPGEYIFRMVTPSVMQVMNEDRSMIYATFFVIPALRADATRDYAVKLEKIRDDTPARVTTLFPSKESRGFELIYSTD
jgi:hypothetical protein